VPRVSVRLARAFLCSGLIALCCGAIAGCVAGSGATGGPPIPAQVRLRIVGTPGTPFHAIVTDKTASWEVTGVIPINIAILKNQPPLRMTAWKLTSEASLMSAEIVVGNTIVHLASTQAPFGTAVVQTAKGLSATAPPANPDVRFFLKASPHQFVQGIIEDINSGFQVEDFVPTLFLFENPDGRVDGLFQQLGTDLGPINVDLIINGTIVASAFGNPTVSIVAP
jgi:hypothetical protein